MDRPRPLLRKLSPALILAVLTAGINVLNEFGVTAVTDRQLNSLNAFAITVLAILVAVGVLSAQGDVTPVKSPLLPDGQSVTLPDGTAGKVERV